MNDFFEDLEPKDLMYLAITGYFVVKAWSVVKKTRRSLTVIKKAGDTLDQVVTDVQFRKIVDTFGTE